MKRIQDTNVITKVMVISKAHCFYTKLATAGEFVIKTVFSGSLG